MKFELRLLSSPNLKSSLEKFHIHFYLSDDTSSRIIKHKRSAALQRCKGVVQGQAISVKFEVTFLFSFKFSLQQYNFWFVEQGTTKRKRRSADEDERLEIAEVKHRL